jgi:outer membrane immunogenic protein
MKYMTSAAAILAAFIATPALAQDEEASFTGPYIGAYVGYDHVTITDGTDDFGKGGVAFGALAGYNFDLGGAVVGIEGEFGDASTQQQEQDILVLGDEALIAANRDLFIGARVGFKAAPKTLVYVKGGYVSTRVKVAYDDNDGFAFAASDNLDGYRIGAGVEYAINSSISLRGEYRYSDHSEYEYQGVSTGLSANRHQVVMAVVGKF